MIVVTVGTTMPFDELLAEVDRLAEIGELATELTCQYGQSTYRMRQGTQFMALPSEQMAPLLNEADLVITHGGATVVQLLLMGKPFVAFPNPRGAGNHQEAFLRQMSTVADISWHSDVRELGPLLAERRRRGPARLRDDVPRLGAEVAQILQDVIETSR